MIGLEVSLIVIVFLTIVSGFLAKELYKKFHFNQLLAGHAEDHVVTFIPGEHPEPHTFKKGTWKIVLRSEEPFAVTCGGYLTVLKKDWGLDYYAFSESTLHIESGFHTAVFEVFISAWDEQPGTLFDIRPFVFFANRTLKYQSIVVSATDADQHVPLTSFSTPHWWQRIGN